MNICLGPNDKKNVLLKYLIFFPQHPSVLIWTKAELLANTAHFQRTVASSFDSHSLLNNSTGSPKWQTNHRKPFYEILQRFYNIFFLQMRNLRSEEVIGQRSQCMFMTNHNMTSGLPFFLLHQIFFLSDSFGSQYHYWSVCLPWVFF